jgi:hypothetical protein
MSEKARNHSVARLKRVTLTNFIDMDMALDRIVPESLEWAHTDEGPE